jgi:DNA-binding PadR family transcriptional regulator
MSALDTRERFGMLPSGKESVVLELLSGSGDMYGLEMVKASQGALRRGTVYVILDRLEDKGFVKSRAEKEPGMAGMPRRRYRITGLGQRALRARQSAQAIMANRRIVIGG